MEHIKDGDDAYLDPKTVRGIRVIYDHLTKNKTSVFESL